MQMMTGTPSTASGPRRADVRSSALTTRRLVVAILFVLLFAMAVRIPLDTDTWWHLRAGERVLADGILTTDPFSLTRGGQPWINHGWGAQLVMVLFTRLFGVEAGLAYYTAALAVAGLVFVYLSCDGNPYVRAFVIVLAAATAAVFWSARPQMASFLWSAVLLYVLHLLKWRKVNRLWLIPVLMLVWVNMHGGFSIGFILLGGFIVGEILGRMFDRANPNVITWRRIGELVLVTAVAALVLVLNPNTTQMWSYPFRTFGIGVLQQFIQEWASPDFHLRETWPFIVMLLGVLAAVGLSGRRIDLTDLVLVSGTAFMALYAGRNIATFALVAAPVLSRHVSAFLEGHGWRLGPARRPRGAALALNWTLIILVCLGAGLKIAATLEPRTVAAAVTDALPVEAAAYLNRVKPPGPMFNTYNWGGYLMYAAPDYPVFVDGRTDLYDDEILGEWLDAMNGRGWQDTFARWNIRLVVIEKDSPLAALLRQDPGWRETHTDRMAAVFERAA
ncbi:MAG: hypothetical protein IT323_18140 [Anaerolineae bacterium]|nr:hypothetical protein [Anaerolineae bacterium]